MARLESDIESIVQRVLDILTEQSLHSESEPRGHYTSKQWSLEEDAALLLLKQSNELLTWEEIAERISAQTKQPKKRKQQVEERWARTLCGETTEFNKEELLHIEDLFRTGFTPAAIAGQLEGRTDVQIRYQLRKLGLK